MKNKRLVILKRSLEKKEAVLNARFSAHFDSVKAANGQPLNDKRDGQATLNRWEKQSDAIRNQIESVDITRAAIEREECKSAEVAYFYSVMPAHIQVLIDNGTLRQWSKHPHIMFVAGVDKARILFDEKTGLCSHKYVKEIKDKAQYGIFRDVYNAIFSHSAPLSGNVFCRASVDARDPTCKAREDCGLFSLTESPSDAVKVIRLSAENGFDCPMYRKTSQRGKSPKAGKGVGRKAKDPTTPVSVRLDQRKILSLKEQGFSEIGVILADDTGKRVTVDKYGRVQWWCVDGSGIMESCHDLNS